MATPSHAAPGPTTVQRVRRLAFWVLGLDFAALAVLGIVLAFSYEPGQAMSDVHNVLGILAVLAALVAAIATVADDERSTAGVLPAIVVLAVVAGLYLTGPSLAWDRIAANEPIEDPKGVTVAFKDSVGALGQGDNEMTAGDYQRIAWLHVVALPVAVLAMGGVGAWALRRKRTYQPQRAMADAPGADAG